MTQSTTSSAIDEPEQPCLVTNSIHPPDSVCMYQVVPTDTADAPAKINYLSALWHCDDPCWMSESNTMYIRADWYRALWARTWTFVPDTEMINSIIQRLQLLKYLKVNASWSTVCPKRESYRYDFVPLALDRTTIHRENPESCSFTSYSPPYKDFPPLRHSCHPYFVIVSAIQAYETHLSKALPDQHRDVYGKLHLIVSLWEDLKDFPLDENAFPAAKSTDGSQEAPPQSPASTEPASEVSSLNATGSGVSFSTSWPPKNFAAFIPPPPASEIPALPSPLTPSASPATKSKKSKTGTGPTTSGTPTASSSSPSNVIHSPSHAGTGVPRNPTAIPSASNPHTDSSTSAPSLFQMTPSTTTPQTTGRPSSTPALASLPMFHPYLEKDLGNLGIVLSYQCLTTMFGYRFKSLEEWRVDAYRRGYKPWPTRAAQPFPPFVPLNPLGTLTNPQSHAQ